MGKLSVFYRGNRWWLSTPAPWPNESGETPHLYVEVTKHDATDEPDDYRYEVCSDGDTLHYQTDDNYQWCIDNGYEDENPRPPVSRSVYRAAFAEMVQQWEALNVFAQFHITY